MSREEKKDAAALEQPLQPQNDQHDESKDTVPANDGQNGIVKNNANEEQKEENVNDKDRRW